MKFAYMPDTRYRVYDQNPSPPDQAVDIFEQIIKEAALAEQLSSTSCSCPRAYPTRDDTQDAIRGVRTEVPPALRSDPTN